MFHYLQQINKRTFVRILNNFPNTGAALHGNKPSIIISFSNINRSVAIFKCNKPHANVRLY